jgi:diacylglycerol kinase (ATP)
LKELSRFKQIEITVMLGSQALQRRMFMFTVGNGISSGGGFLLTPRALLDDGLMDICLVSNATKQRVLFAISEALTGEHLHNPEVEYFQYSKVACVSDDTMTVHADGEIVSRTARKVSVTTLPRSVNFLVADSVLAPGLQPTF